MNKGLFSYIATVGFSLESANVVGYSEGSLREGFKAAGSQFTPIAGDTIDLTSIVVTGYDKEEGTEEEVSVQTLDENGPMLKQYFWYDISDGEEVYYGWLDGDSGDFIGEGEVVLYKGDALWVSSPSDMFKLQSSGQVDTKGFAVTLKIGFKLVANQTPVQLDLTAVKAAGYSEEDGTEEEVSVQTLDENGSMLKQYFWYDISDGEDVYYGWLDGDSGDFIEEGEVMLQPGEAVWVNAPDTAFTLEIPGVNL